jgi:hypothetical protein
VCSSCQSPINPHINWKLSKWWWCCFMTCKSGPSSAKKDIVNLQKSVRTFDWLVSSNVMFMRETKWDCECKLAFKSLPWIHKDNPVSVCLYWWYIWCQVPNSIQWYNSFVQTHASRLVLSCFQHALWYDFHINLSTNRVDHLIRMFLSSCKDFSEHLKEACCEYYFAAQSNIFSLLNSPATIKYGYYIASGKERMRHLLDV